MPGNLLTLPKQVPISSGSTVPGAKLYTYQTGTSTPQNTYQDVGLTTAHANPVVADANGVFAAIYLDPSLPDYRVTLTDADDVQLYQVDDVPAGTDGALNFTLEDTEPYVLFTESDGSSNNKNWRLIATGEQFILQTGNDALSSWVSVLEIDRTGTTVDTVNFTPTNLQHNGASVGSVSAGTFTADWTGFTTSPQTTFNYTRIGNIVTIHADATLQATSNGSTLTSAVGDVPSAIRPTETAVVGWWNVEDNGTYANGRIQINSNGAIVFYPSASSSSFTGSGTKGFAGSQCFTYLID